MFLVFIANGCTHLQPINPYLLTEFHSLQMSTSIYDNRAHGSEVFWECGKGIGLLRNKC